MKSTKGIIFIIVLLITAAALYYFLIYKKKTDPFAPLSNTDNFKTLQAGLGLPATASDRLTLKFNEGKNQADYYNNGRVIIGKVGIAGYVVKGSYKDGGKSIYLDNGKVITAPTPWGALEQTII